MTTSTPPDAGAPVTPPPGTPPPGPADTRPAALVLGVVLVVVGVLFLVVRVADLRFGEDVWPLWIIVPGLALFVASFVVGGKAGLGLAIPGAIIATVGGILWVQEANDLYETWAYAWALVAPTAPGVAMFLYGLVQGDRATMGDGGRTALVGIGLFVGFALFFEGVLGLSGERFAGLDEVFPVLVIGLGALFVVLSLFGRRDRAEG